MKATLLPLIVALSAGLITTQAATDPAPAPEPKVQIALLLDTSNSMDGLIEQAKTQLWKIVNEFNTAKREGKTPAVQVALYEYGNDNLSVGTNYIRQVVPFTRELDKVSEELFKLTTRGGSEFCGAVIRAAIDNLEWDASSKTYKTIFIAGNEPFTQGPVVPDEACKSAIAKGIVVNTIHCGNEADGANGGWRKGAALAEGKYLIIDQDKAVVHIEAPQDAEIVKLSLQLNGTFIPYGKDGARGMGNNTAQDKNASAFKSSGTEVQRALTKGNAITLNSSWDLVDATKREGKKLEALPAAALPAEMKDMKPEERQAYVDKKAAERAELQKQINMLNAERQKFVAQKQKELGQDKTLDTAIATTVREQAAKKDFKFE